jgi:hypothetical protein
VSARLAGRGAPIARRAALHSLITWPGRAVRIPLKTARNLGFSGVAYEIHFATPRRLLTRATRKLAPGAERAADFYFSYFLSSDFSVY